MNNPYELDINIKLIKEYNNENKRPHSPSSISDSSVSSGRISSGRVSSGIVSSGRVSSGIVSNINKLKKQRMCNYKMNDTQTKRIKVSV